jgi:hypothetical protein
MSLKIMNLIFFLKLILIQLLILLTNQFTSLQEMSKKVENVPKERKSEGDIHPHELERRMSDIPTSELEQEQITLEGVGADDVEVVDEETKSIMFSMMKQLKWGMDLTKIMIPCEFLEPRSLLEKLTDFMTHIDIVMKAPDLSDDVERALEVTRWYLSCWHVKPKGVKK